MTVSNNERVGKALELLRQGLRPFIERELSEYYGVHWTSEVGRILNDTRLPGRNTDSMQDVSVQLVVMDRTWMDVFRKTLGRAERSLVNELLVARNRWAHQSSFSIDDADRMLDSASRLLTAVSAPQADMVAKMKMELRRLMLDEQAPKERKEPIATMMSTPSSGQANQRDRVLEFITRFPGRDDDEIASARDFTTSDYQHDL